MTFLRKTKHPSPAISISWDRFAINIQKDIKLLLLCFCILGLFRILLIYRFYDHLKAHLSAKEFVLAVLNGARFDGVVAGYVVLPLVLFSIICGFVKLCSISDRIRKIMMLLFIWLSALIFIANYAFIAEFKDNFNQLIFNLIYDDFKAIIQSAWSDYPLLQYFLVSFIASSLITYGGLRLIKTPFTTNFSTKWSLSGKVQKVIATGIVFLLLFVSLRGSLGARPVQPKDAGITQDPFLNKLIINPYIAIDEAVRVHHLLTGRSGIEKFLPDKDMSKAIEMLFQKRATVPNIDHYLEKSTKGNSGTPPRHIFLIIMESLDSWSLLKSYQSFQLLPNFQQLGSQGILIKAFLPASSGTMTTLSAILTGLPDVGIFTNYTPRARTPFPSSIATQFKRLGYETHFYYGGYLTWQRIYDFCKDQGFEYIHGGAEMEKWQLKEWGVDDHIMFDYISSKLTDEKPTFNIILSTSNHSPYDIPVYEWGFPYRKIPPELEDKYDGKQPLSVFGHLWYSDKVMAQFIRRTEKQLPGSLFAVTGDHRSHKYLTGKYTRYERVSVPLVIYGKPFIAPWPSSKASSIAGSHMDIMPTLIELCAPKGFRYYSLGSDLLDPDRRQIGFGMRTLITPYYIVDIKHDPEKLPFLSESRPFPDIITDRKLIQAYKGIGWWRLMKGPKFPLNADNAKVIPQY